MTKKKQTPTVAAPAAESEYANNNNNNDELAAKINSVAGSMGSMQTPQADNMAELMEKSTKPMKTKEEKEAEKLARYRRFAERAQEHRDKLAKMSKIEKEQYMEKRNKAVAATRKLKQSGLIFPTKRVHKMMRRMCKGYKIHLQPAIYTAAIMEYMAAEVLELAGNYSKAQDRKRIQPRHIMLAIRQDEEISKLIPPSTVMKSTGVPLKIIPACLKNNFPRKDFPTSCIGLEQQVRVKKIDD